MAHRCQTLRREICKRSVAVDDWLQAQMEWDWHDIVDMQRDIRAPDIVGKCLCSQPLRIVHVIQHQTSGEQVEVGSVCLTRFFTNNIVLVDRVRRAERERFMLPCVDCNELTTRADRRCKPCFYIHDNWVKCARCPKMMAQGDYCAACKPIALTEHDERWRERDPEEWQRHHIQWRVNQERRLHKDVDWIYKCACGRSIVRNRQECVACEFPTVIAPYVRIKAMINMQRLYPTERKFVEESVRECVLTGKKLSDKQRAWLKSIVRRVPALAPMVRPIEPGDGG